MERIDVMAFMAPVIMAGLVYLGLGYAHADPSITIGVSLIVYCMIEKRTGLRLLALVIGVCVIASPATKNSDLGLESANGALALILAIFCGTVVRWMWSRKK